MGMHHRFIAFDSPFERFIYMDGDTLLLDAVDKIFAILDRHDRVVYDFQHKYPTHVYEVSQPKLFEVFSRDCIEKEIFCAGFYASKIGLFDENQRDWLIEQLRAGEAEILYPMAPDQTIVDYMMMRSNFSMIIYPSIA
jgi:lipopolysaccharide biosynthesis glycosyltransferase